MTKNIIFILKSYFTLCVWGEGRRTFQTPLEKEIQVVVNHAQCGFREPNSGPLQEQQILLPGNISLSTYLFFLS